ncbi:MAG: hypothetical protein COV35_06140 [Alphaproteobacteria bacterium CG11_big_fil_rev_8_21_14_0_20_39_49]|nr:MAG: hypothetical protein COV35_06140 [Alphaproteobacteria bacterium CG11_big_fil_rev_8_21_14_0_20_39_49]
MDNGEELIVRIMKEAKCYGQENMIRPDDLIAKCAEKGITDGEKVSAAIVSLIDQDVVEYEMDDNLKTTELWLL